ncbi:hypothetical protein Barb4_02622 [Bacteroidales bacterium Barb4]|nr:hypothetical protein Barb4_02622 [Bacteroidales bacterium Barb4]
MRTAVFSSMFKMTEYSSVLKVKLFPATGMPCQKSAKLALYSLRR